MLKKEAAFDAQQPEKGSAVLIDILKKQARLNSAAVTKCLRRASPSFFPMSPIVVMCIKCNQPYCFQTTLHVC